ncbi:MAG TPA: AsmA family protein [Dongiaceae bacterium]|nr:AsmA family protein [Dongiaceae bacterium]
MSSAPASAPRKRRRWPLILGCVVGGLFLLLLVGYFVVTSQGFLKSFVLPRVGKAINATVTADAIAFHPFHELDLQNLKVQTAGAEPCVTAAEVHVRYELFNILKGNIDVDEITLVAPTVNVVQNADGTSNLDPLLKSQSSAAPKPAATKSAAPPQINLGRLTITNATVRLTQNKTGGLQDRTELSGVNLVVTGLKNGQSGKLTLEALVQLAWQSTNAASSGSVQARLTGAYDFALTAALQPASVQGNTRLTVAQASGVFGDFATFGANLDCDITPTEVKNVALRFEKSGASLGSLRVAGPLDLQKLEGRLQVELGGLDRQVLNLAGASSGLDFSTTTLNSTNQIELTQSGNVIGVSGNLNASRLQVVRAAQSTPVLDLRAGYRVTVNRSAKSLQLQTFTLDATQNQNPLLHGELSKPMDLSWGGGSAGAGGDANLLVKVSGLNLADWRAFASGLNPAGRLNATLNLASQQGGKQLSFDLDSSLQSLAVTLGTNTVQNADVRLTAKGQVADLKQISLASYGLELAQRGEPALAVSGSGSFDSGTQAADLQVQVHSVLARLLALLPSDGVKLGDGMLDFKGHVVSTAQSQSVSGDLALTNLMVSAVPGPPLAVNLQLDVARTGQTVDLRKFLVKLTPTTRAANQLALTGQVNLSQPDAITGQLRLAAEALDVTGYYDLFAGKSSAASPTTASNSPVKAPPMEEPKAIKLPFQNFVLDAAIGRLYLHEVAVTNLQTTVKLDGAKVALQPFQLTLNGAPVAADANVNLGVPGYEYDLNFTATKVSVAPLADTFMPAYKGQAKGDLSASAKIHGAGITGVNLQKHLSGDASLVLTNANIQLVGPKAKALITPIAFVLGLNELLTTPLNALQVQVKMGNGQVTLSKFEAASVAYQADTAGSIPIAPVLNDSPIANWPVNLSLSRDLAGKARLLTSDTPTNVMFVQLPAFVHLNGTLGKPEATTDKLVIAGLIARSVGGIPGVVGGKAGNVIQGIGSVLTGTTTNVPVANEVGGGLGKLLQATGGLLGGQNTNTPATNAPVRNLLEDLLRKK